MCSHSISDSITNNNGRALQVTYRVHRKLILEAIAHLKAQQPEGFAKPGNMWQYIHQDPTKASLYLSGVLCTPRLSLIWLYIFECASCCCHCPFLPLLVINYLC